MHQQLTFRREKWKNAWTHRADKMISTFDAFPSFTPDNFFDSVSSFEKDAITSTRRSGVNCLSVEFGTRFTIWPASLPEEIETKEGEDKGWRREAASERSFFLPLPYFQSVWWVRVCPGHWSFSPKWRFSANLWPIFNAVCQSADLNSIWNFSIGNRFFSLHFIYRKT